MTTHDDHEEKSREKVHVPATIMRHVLGDRDLRTIDKTELAVILDDTIKFTSNKTKEMQGTCAMALYAARAFGTYTLSGYKSWESYVTGISFENLSFSTPRQARKYLAAVELWVVQLGFDTQVLFKYGPALLGEIAQTGVVKTKEDAKFWLRRAEERLRSELRQDLSQAAKLLDAPSAPSPAPTSFSETDSDAEEAEHVDRALSETFDPSNPMDTLNLEFIEAKDAEGRPRIIVIVSRGDKLEVGRYTSFKVNISHSRSEDLSPAEHDIEMEKGVQKLKEIFGSDGLSEEEEEDADD